MNSVTLTLSSTNTQYSKILNTLHLKDYTEMSVDFSRISEKYFPLYVKIDWGDGVNEFYDNDVFKYSQYNTKKSEFMNVKKYHRYYPSDKSLYKNLSAQFLIKYVNGDTNWFVQPISIRNYDYFESVEDLEISGLQIFPDESEDKRLTLKTKKDSYIINFVLGDSTT